MAQQSGVMVNGDSIACYAGPSTTSMSIRYETMAMRDKAAREEYERYCLNMKICK